MTTKNFVVKNGVTTGNIILDAASGNITSTNANLGNAVIANYFIGNFQGNLQVTGGNTQVVFNDDGNANASAAFTFNKSTNTVSMSNALSVTGNANVGNLGATSVIANTFNSVGSAALSIGTGGATSMSIGGASTTSITIAGGTASNSVSYTMNLFPFGGVYDASSNRTLNFGTDGGYNTGQVKLNVGSQYSNTYSNIFGIINVANTSSLTGTINTVLLTASGNITAPQLISNVATGTAPFVVTSTTQVANLTVASAGLATYATTANAVAGANVSGQVGNALVAGTVYTNAQPNITSTGTLTSLTVSGTSNLGAVGNVTITGGTSGYYLQTDGAGALSWASVPTGTGISNGNSNVAIPSSNGNVNITAVGNTTLVITGTGANITGTGNITGNANVGNLGTAGLVVATGNVTGGNLTTGGLVSATGNVTGGNLTTGGAVVATGNVTGGNLTTSGILSVTGTGVSSIAGNLDMTSNNIINLATPVNSTDAATKQYVDDVAQGLNVHDSCQAATTGTLATATGGTITYNNGTSGVGATLTTTGSYTTIDGVNVATAGLRILVKNEANAAHNGIYTYTSSTVITRATDYNSVPEVEAGDFVFVTGGTSYDNTGWAQTSTVTTMGTDPIEFTQFSGAGTYTAGTGLTLTGTVFSVNASQTQITSVGTLGSLAVTANANVGNLYAGASVQGATLTSNTATGTPPLTVLSTTRVSNLNVAYSNVADFINVTAPGSGVVYIIGANATTGNIAEYTSSGISMNLSNNAITATTFVGNISGNASSSTTAATVTTNAQPNITSTGTLTSLTVSGNIGSGNVITTNVVLSSIQSNRANVSVTTNTVIDQFAPATYRTAKYVISASSANGYQSVEAILVHDGTSSYVTIYGSVCSNATADIVDISSNINGVSGNTTLYATSSGGTATVNLVATYLKT